MSISILIPVYNAEKYLVQCIESIIKQEFYEVILVNDGSTDNSGLICNEYAKSNSRIHVFHQENKGVSAARNLALEKATGEWVAFVDADDWVEDFWYEIVLENILKYEDIDVFTFGFNRVNEGVNRSYIRSFDIQKTDDYLQCSYSPIGCCYVYRLSKIRADKISFPLGIKLSEDQCFILKYLSLSTKIVIIDKALYNYYEHENSAVNQSAGKEITVNSLLAANIFLRFALQHKVSQIFFYKAITILYEEFFHFYTLTRNRSGIQPKYNDEYNRTVDLYPDFKKNKHFFLASYNLKFAVWFHYFIRNLKKIKKIGILIFR